MGMLPPFDELLPNFERKIADAVRSWRLDLSIDSDLLAGLMPVDIARRQPEINCSNNSIELIFILKSGST